MAKRFQDSRNNAKDPRVGLAFPTLSAKQIKVLETFGKPAHVPKGEYVWHAGQADLCMYVVVKGAMDILDGRTEKLIATHRAGSFSGDVDVVSGRPSIVSAKAATNLELLEIAADCVRNIVGEQPDLGEMILRAFLMRRSLLLQFEVVGLLVVGSRYSPDSLRVREFLARNHIPSHWEDLESMPNIDRTLKEFGVTPDETPVVILQDGRMLKVPSNVEISEALGIRRTPETKYYDLVVVGAGPAGLAAAVYGASEGLSTLIVDANNPGGQAGTSSRIENYLGFPLGVSGQTLTDSALIQAERFGAQMVLPAEVQDITCSPAGGHEVGIDGLGRVHCRCVILASGATYRKLEAANLDRFEGRGVYYSATNVERMLCGDSAVAVVGAGNSAGQAAVYMAQNASRVYLIVRGDDLGKSMSRYLARRIETSDRISVLLNSEICDLDGDDTLRSAVVRDRKTGTSQSLDISGIFVMIGAIPHTDWLPEQIVRDPKGFILTGQQAKQSSKWSQPRAPFLLETTCPGVFAAGDARADSVKRVASAVGEGSMAVAFVHQYLAL